MKYIGIHKYTKQIFGGDDSNCFPLPPDTQLYPLSIYTGSIDMPLNESYEFGNQFFRETYFDPVTQIRKGMIYQWHNETLPWYRADDIEASPHGHNQSKPMHNIVAYHVQGLSEFKDTSQKASKPAVIIGSGNHKSLWKIINIEQSVLAGPVVTLKAQYQFGVVPEIDAAKVPLELYSKLRVEMDKVIDSANKLDPTAIVDRCRDTLSLALGHIAGDMTKDLGNSIAAIRKKNQNRDNKITWAGNLVARLHAQGKPVERENRSLDELEQNHAQLALSCLWLVLNELKWLNQY